MESTSVIPTTSSGVRERKPRIKKSGVIRRVDRRGELLSETMYVNGKKHGMEVIRRNEYMIYATYWKGTLHGLYQVKKNGRLMREVHYIHGQMMGIMNIYRDSMGDGVSDESRILSRQQYVGEWIREGPEMIKTEGGNIILLNNRTFGLSELEIREGYKADPRNWQSESDAGSNYDSDMTDIFEDNT